MDDINKDMEEYEKGEIEIDDGEMIDEYDEEIEQEAAAPEAKEVIFTQNWKEVGLSSDNPGIVGEDDLVGHVILDGESEDSSDIVAENDIADNANDKKSKYLKAAIPIHNDSTEQSVDCKICKIKFKYKQNLVRHMRLRHPMEVFNCTSCKCSYKYAKDLTRHIKDKHHGRSGARIKIEGDHVENVLRNQPSHRQMPQILPKMEQILPKMTQILPKMEQILPNMPQILPNFIQNFKVLGGAIASPAPLLAPAQQQVNIVGKTSKANRIYMNKSENYNCNDCNYIAQFEINLQKHIRKYHPDKCLDSEIIQNICNLCDKKFSNERGLKNHIRRIHSKNKILFECNICNKVYGKKTSLVEHQKKHHPDDHSKGQCQVIQQLHNDQDDVEKSNIIIKILNSNEPVAFRIITEKFKTPPENIKRVECQVCNKKFKGDKMLQQHMKRIHHISSSERSASKSCCVKECSKSFFTMKELRLHLMDSEEAGGHNCTIEEEEHIFSSMKEFIQWKEDVEENDDSRYISITSTRMNKDGSTKKTFHCSRSGKYCFKGTGKRKAKREGRGTNKINGYCPSTMSISHGSDEIVKCTYYRTHIGHGKSAEDLIHIPMHNRDRLYIKEKILEGVDPKRIKEDLHGKGGRSTYIRTQDIRNTFLAKLPPVPEKDAREKLIEEAQNLSIQINSSMKNDTNQSMDSMKEIVEHLKAVKCLVTTISEESSEPPNNKNIIQDHYGTKKIYIQSSETISKEIDNAVINLLENDDT